MKIETARFEFSAGTLAQIPPGDLPEIVFSGKSNVGKSTLINKLLNRKSLARVSAKPGKTATINSYLLDTCRLIDLPGYGYAKVSRAEKQRWAQLVNGYLESDRPIALVVQIIDIRHDPTQDDRQMSQYLLDRAMPFVVVATKSDKLNATQRRERLAALEELFAGAGIVFFPFSAVKGEGVETLRERIDSLCTPD